MIKKIMTVIVTIFIIGLIAFLGFNDHSKQQNNSFFDSNSEYIYDSNSDLLTVFGENNLTLLNEIKKVDSLTLFGATNIDATQTGFASLNNLEVTTICGETIIDIKDGYNLVLSQNVFLGSVENNYQSDESGQKLFLDLTPIMGNIIIK